MEKAERKRDAITLFFKDGLKVTEIAIKLGLSKGTVSNYLKEAREEWAEQANITISEHVNEELAKIRDQEVNIYQWLDFFKINPEDPETTKRNSPDARKWVETWLKLAERKAALLGLDRAKKFEGNIDGPVIINLLPADGGEDERIIEGQFTEVDDDEEDF